MADLNKTTLVKQLIESGIRIDLANQYGDAFMEYMNATRNIDEFGVIVKHPRTGNPIENPYLAIRDRALKKLQAMEMVRADFLWEQYA